jgi:hypothetical protein
MNEAPTADGGPGFLAFLAFFLLALALWFLMRNMNARMRRMSYRQRAAHRGKDDPQVAPGELVAEEDGPVAGPAGVTEATPAAGEVDDPGVPDGSVVTDAGDGPDSDGSRPTAGS